MRCVLYSMEHGKVEINNAKSVKIYGSSIAEIEIYAGHQPIIGEITGGFEVMHYQEEPEIYEVNLGFFEYSKELLTIVANFKQK